MEFNENKLKGNLCHKLGHLNKILEFVCTSPTCEERFLCSICFLKDHQHHSIYVSLIDFMILDKNPINIDFSDLDINPEFQEIVENHDPILENFKKKLNDEKKTLITDIQAFKCSYKITKERICKNINDSHSIKINDFINALKNLKSIIDKQNEKQIGEPKIIECSSDLEFLLENYNKPEKEEFSMTNLPQSYFELKLMKNMTNKLDFNLLSELKSYVSSFFFSDSISSNMFRLKILNNLTLIHQKNFKDLKNNVTLNSDHKKCIRQIIFLDKEELFATASDDACIKIWDFKTHELRKTLLGHTDKILCLIKVGLDKLVSAGNDQKIRIWNYKDKVASSEIKILTGHLGIITSLIELPEEKIISGSYDQTIRFWDLQNWKMYQTYKNDKQSRVFSLELINNMELAVGNDNNINIYHIDSGNLIKILKGHTNVVQKMIYLYKKNILISGGIDSKIRSWDIDSGDCLGVLDGHGPITNLLLFQDNILISTSEDCSIKFWDIENKLLVHSLEKEEHTIYSMKMLQDGRLVTVGFDKCIRIWE